MQVFRRCADGNKFVWYNLIFVGIKMKLLVIVDRLIDSSTLSNGIGFSSDLHFERMPCELFFFLSTIDICPFYTVYAKYCVASLYSMQSNANQFWYRKFDSNFRFDCSHMKLLSNPIQLIDLNFERMIHQRICLVVLLHLCCCLFWTRRRVEWI